MTVRIPISRISLPGHLSPSAGFDAPFDMLTAGHDRVIRTLALLDRLRQHMDKVGCDADAADAAKDVIRYFDVAAPRHHEDEELHVFPALLATEDSSLHEIVIKLKQDHKNMECAWSRARKVLVKLTVVDCQISNARFSDADQAALSAFSELYDQHIEMEESLAYPAAIQRLSNEALQVMGEDMMMRRRG